MSLGTVQGLSTERWEVFSKVHPRGVWDMFVTQTRPSFVRGAGLLAGGPAPATAAGSGRRPSLLCPDSAVFSSSASCSCVAPRTMNVPPAPPPRSLVSSFPFVFSGFDSDDVKTRRRTSSTGSV